MSHALCNFGRKKRGVRDDIKYTNQLENCQARYRSNTWMCRTRTDGPDEFEPSKCDCIQEKSPNVDIRFFPTIRDCTFKKSAIYEKGCN